jgi:hypothetical protein
MELNETKRTFSLSSIHKNFQICKNVLKMAATFILLSLISATLGISLNMIHPKDSTIHSLKTGMCFYNVLSEYRFELFLFVL